ncbi:hypothetical protein ACUV84_011530 [Puccinellia chinampoensis]
MACRRVLDRDARGRRRTGAGGAWGWRAGGCWIEVLGDGGARVLEVLGDGDARVLEVLRDGDGQGDGGQG